MFPILVHTQIFRSFTYYAIFRNWAAMSYFFGSSRSIRGIKLSGQSEVDRSYVQFSGVQMKTNNNALDSKNHLSQHTSDSSNEDGLISPMPGFSADSSAV